MTQDSGRQTPSLPGPSKAPVRTKINTGVQEDTVDLLGERCFRLIADCRFLYHLCTVDYGKLDPLPSQPLIRRMVGCGGRGGGVRRVHLVTRRRIYKTLTDTEGLESPCYGLALTDVPLWFSKNPCLVKCLPNLIAVVFLLI